MDKNELERRIESAEKQNLGLLDEIKNLKEKLAEMQDEPEIPDFPIFKPAGEEAWHINNILEVSTPGITSGTACDFNYFHTKEYAQEFADKCKLIAMMLHCKWHIDRDFVPDWDNCDDKFTVWYNHADTVWTIDYQEIHETPSIYFSTEEAAKSCANWLNKHWSGCDD